MSLGLVCDACGESLLVESDVRYIVQIRGYAAYDPLEITQKDLDRDFRRDMEELIRKLEEEDPEKAQDEVYREFRLDLCPRCWALYRRDPLLGVRGAAARGAVSRGEPTREGSARSEPPEEEPDGDSPPAGERAE